jgi:hypothetical protein
MKTLFSFLFALALALPVLAQTETKDKPAIKFKSENHDFGKITEGVQATHEFEFVNTGKGALIISNVAASCGCTTPDWTREPIAPGKTGKIKAVYNSQGRPGQFTKQVTVTSNAAEATKVLTISGLVEKVEPGVPETKPAASPVTKP